MPRKPLSLRDKVRRALTPEWQSTHAVFLKVNGGKEPSEKVERNKLRADVFWHLDCLHIQGEVDRRKVSDDHYNWRLMPKFREDHFTSTVEGAAAYERMRAGHAGPW
jgi:hypothetical protein